MLKAKMSMRVIQARFSPDEFEQIENWRRVQPQIPNLGDAIGPDEVNWKEPNMPEVTEETIVEIEVCPECSGTGFANHYLSAPHNDKECWKCSGAGEIAVDTKMVCDKESGEFLPPGHEETDPKDYD